MIEIADTKNGGIGELLSRLGGKPERGISGYVFQTVPAVILAGLRNDWNFKTTVAEIIEAGGDTDTTAAIAGALCGAFGSRPGIPGDWIGGMKEWPVDIGRLPSLARALVHHTPLRIRARWSPVLLLRNLVFLAVVLVHGFGRMIPRRCHSGASRGPLLPLASAARTCLDHGVQDDRFFQQNHIENHLGIIFDDLPGFIYFVKDRDRRYVAFNARLCEIFETTSAKILGKSDEDFIPPHILEDILQDDLRVLGTGESIVNRVELVPRGSGFVDWSTTTKKPLHNQDGEICGMIGITRPFDQGTTSLSMNDELGTALQLLHREFRDNIAITALANTANLSLSSFLRKFKVCFNMTPKAYLRHLRIQEACHLIVRTTQPLSQIGLHCGFADQAHFSREFSRIMKEPPSAYRKRYRI